MDLKIKDVAELLNVSETTIRRWLAENKIPAYRLNHQYRFSRNEIEDWLMSCKQPSAKSILDKEESGEEKHSGGTNAFSLFRAVHKGLVLNNIEGRDKETLIHQTMKIAAGRLKADAELLTELLLDREKLMPTALNHGVAVPHTRDFLFKDSFDLVFVVYPKEPIEYGALDGEKVHTLFFLFACEDKRHLHLLAKLAHLTSDPESLEFLKAKPDKADLLQQIKKWEAGIQQQALTQPTV